MTPKRTTVELDGQRVDIVALLIHSILIFAYWFLVVFPATAASGHPSVHAALFAATMAASLKVVTYLAKRTGAPLDGARSP